MYKNEFPITKDYIFLDHAGVAPVSMRVKKAVERFTTEALEVGLSHYRLWVDNVDKTRSDCAKLINANKDEIAFIKNTSHGLSIVAEGLDWNEGENILVCEKEFPANIYPWLNLQRKGVTVKFIPFREGRILIEDIEKLIDPKTKLLTISSVQFSNGFKIDLKKVGALCRNRGVFFCVDAIQSLGVLHMNVKDFNVDFLSADGHKWLLSPEGTGIFYCRKTLIEKINPPLIGWNSVQKAHDFDHINFLLKPDAQKFEEGSLNILGIYALGASLDLLFEIGIDKIESTVLELGDLIIAEAEKRDFTVKTPKAKEERGGIVSIVGNFNPIDIKNKLKNMNIIVNVRDKAIRISPHFYNTEDEIYRLFDSIDMLTQ